MAPAQHLLGTQVSSVAPAQHLLGTPWENRLSGPSASPGSGPLGWASCPLP